MEESKPTTSFWRHNPNSKFVGYGMIVLAGLYVAIGVYEKIKESLEIKALEKPVTMSYENRFVVLNGETIQKNGLTYDLGHLVSHEIHLTTETGKRYWIRDTEEDGYIPNDKDGLVDLVSVNSVNTEYPNHWIQRKFSERLFSVLTKRYKEKLAEEDSSKVIELLNKSEWKK